MFLNEDSGSNKAEISSVSGWEKFLVYGVTAALVVMTASGIFIMG